MTVFETLDERFGACIKSAARLELLSEGCRWAEGPAYFPAGRYLVWSDIPNNRQLRWLEDDWRVTVFRTPSKRIAVGYAGTSHLSHARTELVLRTGDYLIDAPAVQEHRLSGLQIPPATMRAIDDCRFVDPRASDRWPLGYRILGRRRFTTARDFRAAIDDLIASHMPEEVGSADVVSFREDIAYRRTPDGFELQAAKTRRDEQLNAADKGDTAARSKIEAAYQAERARILGFQP